MERVTRTACLAAWAGLQASRLRMRVLHAIMRAAYAVGAVRTGERLERETLRAYWMHTVHLCRFGVLVTERLRARLPRTPSGWDRV